MRSTASCIASRTSPVPGTDRTLLPASRLFIGSSDIVASLRSSCVGPMRRVAAMQGPVSVRTCPGHRRGVRDTTGEESWRGSDAHNAPSTFFAGVPKVSSDGVSG